MSPGEDKPEDLGISVADEVKASEQFGKDGKLGKLDRQMKGIGGTLHLTNQGDKVPIVNTAWTLSEQTGKPVIVVVRAPRKV